jgi:Holliday junction resolvasome RuvABC endonuclease subunit
MNTLDTGKFLETGTRQPPKKSACVLGLDLSLRGSAAVVLPKGWNPADPWKGIVFKRFGESGSLEGIKRTDAVVADIDAIMSGHSVDRVYLEQYAFSFSANAITHIAELVGVIKWYVWQHYLTEVVPIVASSARKTFFGKLPRMERKVLKAFIGFELDKLGAPFANEDTRDAFCIANAGRFALGLPCLVSPQEEPSRVRAQGRSQRTR